MDSDCAREFPTEGLLAWWKFDGDTTDFIGDNDGSIVGVADFIPGHANQAIRFDGNANYVNVGNPAPLRITGKNISISAWVYNRNWHGGIVSERNNWNLNDYDFYIANHKLYFSFYNGSSNKVTFYGTEMITDEWYHVAVTYDGDYIRLYINGREVKKQAETGSLTNNSQNLYIGHHFDGVNYYLNGTIDDVMVYNRGLSAEEIYNLYLMRNGVICADNIGCSYKGEYCDEKTYVPYTCSYDLNGCLVRVNLDPCGSGENCVNGKCVSEADFDGWRVLPIRTKAEFNLSLIGGETEQHPTSMTRSLHNLDFIYWAHDVGGSWKSTDGGESWKKCLDINLPIVNAQSIKVDPENPNIVFMDVNTTWDWLINPSYSGLYKSIDGCDSWTQVISQGNSAYTYGVDNIAYDLTSISNGKANRWYSAFSGKGLYKSEDGGDNWSKLVDLTGHNEVFQVTVHPTNKKVYLASSKGAFYINYGESSLNVLGNIPAGAVSTIQINPQNTNIIYATLYGKGLYKSTDGGQTFSLLKGFNAQGVYMNTGYPNTLYLAGLTTNNDNNTIITHDGGVTWITDMKTRTSTGEIGKWWKGGLSGIATGFVPNPLNENESVAFSRGTVWKTVDGGHYFNYSSTLFTGFAANHIEFDKYNPNRIMTFNSDVGNEITNTGWDYFEYANNGAESWYNAGLVEWTGTYSGDFEPIEGSQKVVSSVGYYFRSQIMYSEDSGKTWTLVTNGSENIDKNDFIAYNTKTPNIVYAGKKISHDGGKTFSNVDFSGPGGDFNADDPYLIGMCLANPNIVYAMDQECYKVFRSDDAGQTWRIYAGSESGVRHRRLDDHPTFAVDPIECDKIYGLKNYDLAVFNGTDWRKTGILDRVGRSSTADLGNYIRGVRIDPNNNSIVYARMSAAGVSNIWRSLDGGYTWQDITFNHPRTGGGFKINPHTGEILLGSGFGVWVLPSPYSSNNYLYEKGVSMPSCRDRLKNGDETGVDCGGSCLSTCGEISVSSLKPTPPSLSLIDRLINFLKEIFT
jgi:photosystem II stability/assembly factor-like uncharacterized protein